MAPLSPLMAKLAVPIDLKESNETDSTGILYTFIVLA